MKKLLILFLATITSVSFTTNDNGTIKLILGNVTKQGKIYVAVHKQNDKFPDGDDKVVKQLVGTCSTASCVFTFSNLPYGEYAIAIYQDENGNGKLDTGTFGVPKEPFAFSNNFKPKFGGPDFDKCKFTLNQAEQTLSVDMINSLFGGK